MKKLVLLLSTVIAVTLTGTAHAQGTAFAYQGRLQNNGAPANGNYDLMFTLFTTNAGGLAVAGPVVDSATPVTNGLFTVTIDFGSGVFAGNNYWLDISVSPSGSNTFTELTPRQPILPTPYAMMATTASNLLGGLPASQVTGTIPMTQLSSAILTNTETGVTLTGTFLGNGNGLTALNPANLSAGTAAINISGNAATATTAASAASATIATTATTAATANNFSGSLSGDVTGTQSATVVSSVGGVSAASVASGANAANNAISSNTSGAIVQRDASGNFSAGTITANLSGTATAATTALNFSGNVADSQLSANVPLLTGTNAYSGTNTFAGVTSATNANNTFAGTFTGNGTGLTALNPANLSAGTAAINISGNAATATTATTASSATTATSATAATTAGTAGIASNLVSGAVVSGVTVTNSTFAGNGSSLTALNPASLSAGTAAINISGNAATATAANTASSATTAASATVATTATTAGTAGIASNLVAGADISGVFVTNSTFAGNGAGLTALNPANLSSGTAAINISGNAATATTANTAASATTAASAATATTAGTAAIASNLVSGANVSGVFVTNSTFAGNGTGLTGLNASQLNGSVPSASLTSVPAGNLTGTVPLAQMPSAVVTNTESGVTLSGAFTGTFSGSFSGSTNVTAAGISTNGSSAGQVLTLSGGVTSWQNANPWVGGTPTLVTNSSILSSNAVLIGHDRAFFLGFLTSAANQPQSSSNYFTIKLSQALSTNAVVATYSPGAMGKWTNSPINLGGVIVFEQTFQLTTTSNSITVQSIVSPASSSSYGMYVHVDQY